MIEGLRTLPKERYRCVVYTTADNTEYDDIGLPVRRLPGGLLTFWRAVRRRLFDDSMIVVAPIHSALLLGSSRPFIFTLHDVQEKYLPQNFSLAVRIWRHVINRLLTRSADAILCESTYVKEDVRRFFGARADKISVIPAPPILVSGLDTRTEDPSSGRSERYVFYPAQFWPHKNHMRLVEAFARVADLYPDCLLVLTGEQRGEFAAVFKRVHVLGLSERVRHVGHVDRGRLADLYRNAAMVVIPTLFESISIPVYEAFASGTPVCASNILALPEQIGDAGLLFDPRSVEDMAKQIATLLGDAALRAKLIERGRNRMRAVNHEKYSCELGKVIDAVSSRERNRIG
jgi:glycosyltransferase involved in cell wall biosynthesis